MAIAQATVQERKNEAQLNAARAEKESMGIIQGATPATAINIVELIIVLGAAITVDAIDLLDLTGFGAIISRIVDGPALLGLWLWRILKQQSGPKKDPTFSILMTFLGELSPIGILPFWTIFVLYCYFQNTKLGQKTIGKAKKISQIKQTKNA